MKYSLVEILQNSFGEKLETLRFYDHMLLTTLILYNLLQLQRTPISHAYGSFTMLGEEFEDKHMETVLNAFDGESVFQLYIALEYLLPIIKERFYQMSLSVPKLMNSGLAADFAEDVALAYINAASPVDLGEDIALRQAEEAIRQNGDPMGLLVQQAG